MEPNEPGTGALENSSMPNNNETLNPSQPASWLDKLSDENKKVAEAKGWKTDADLDKAFKSYAEMERLSSQKISLPKDDDAEGIDKLMRKLGKPESPEGYAFGNISDEEKPLIDEFKKFAFANHLPAKTAAALVKFEKELGGRVAKEREAAADADFEKIQTAGEERVKKEWGLDTTKNMELAKRGEKVITALFGEDAAKLIKDVVPRYAFLTGVKRIADTVSDDNILTLSGSKSTETPQKDNKAFLQNLFDEAKSKSV